MSVIAPVPGPIVAPPPAVQQGRDSYLHAGYSVKSWLLTIDHKLITASITCCEANFFQQFLHDRLQTARSNIFNIVIHINCNTCNFLNRICRKFQIKILTANILFLK